VARERDRLSAVKVSQVKVPGMYPDGAGLYLRIGPTGAKSWVLRYRHDGKRHDMGLGPFPDVGLAEARSRASVLRVQRLDGTCPLTARRAGRERVRVEAAAARARAMTFRQCAEAYIAAHEAGWRNAKHGAQWGNTLSTYVYPVFGELPVAAVDPALVLKVLEPIWSSKTETASRVRGRIEAVVDWAAARGHRSGENPARWRGHLDKLLPRKSKVSAVEHHAALAYDSISEFVEALRQRDSIDAAALELVILTACRTSEALNATWDEVDFAAKLWTIPGKRMKSGREHRGPLSGAALAVLERMKSVRQSDFIFPGRVAQKPLSNMALLTLLKRMNRAELTAHGFRSTFRDWAAERTSFPNEVAEMALAHVVGDKVEAAYRRGELIDKRRKLMEAWADFCARPAGTSANVRALRGRSVA
jgi:integrase